MTTPTTTEQAPIDPTGGQTAVNPLESLRTVRAARKTTARKRTTARKAPVKRAPAASRAETAAKKGKYADRIVGAIKTGAAVLGTRAPVQARILLDTAEEWGAALDRVAAEDKRVDAFLARVSGIFGKTSAWGDLGAVAAKTGAALALSSGMLPGGPAGLAVAFLGGKLVEESVRSVAYEQAEELLAKNGIGPENDDDYHRLLNAEAAARAEQMIRELHERARRPEPQADDPTPTTAVPAPGAAESWAA